MAQNEIRAMCGMPQGVTLSKVLRVTSRRLMWGVGSGSFPATSPASTRAAGDSPAPSQRGVGTVVGERRGASNGNRQALFTSCVEAHFCHPYAASRLQNLHGARVARPSRRVDHDDLHACAQPWWARRAQPARSDVARGRFAENVGCRTPSRLGLRRTSLVEHFIKRAALGSRSGLRHRVSLVG